MFFWTGRFLGKKAAWSSFEKLSHWFASLPSNYRRLSNCQSHRRMPNQSVLCVHVQRNLIIVFWIELQEERKKQSVGLPKKKEKQLRRDGGQTPAGIVFCSGRVALNEIWHVTYIFLANTTFEMEAVVTTLFCSFQKKLWGLREPGVDVSASWSCLD